MANKPVLCYGIEAMAAAGIREIGIVVGDPREIIEVQDLIDRGLDVRPHIVDGWWKDTGTLGDNAEIDIRWSP